MKTVAPNPQHQAFRAALERAIGEEGADMAMQVVISNMQQGNSEVVERLLNETGGHA